MQNAFERAAILTTTDMIDVKTLPEPVRERRMPTGRLAKMWTKAQRDHPRDR